MKLHATVKFETLRNLSTVRMTALVGPRRQPVFIAEFDRKEFAALAAVQDPRTGTTTFIPGKLVSR